MPRAQRQESKIRWSSELYAALRSYKESRGTSFQRIVEAALQEHLVKPPADPNVLYVERILSAPRDDSEAALAALIRAQAAKAK
jgi:hypothetical protein